MISKIKTCNFFFFLNCFNQCCWIERKKKKRKISTFPKIQHNKFSFHLRKCETYTKCSHRKCENLIKHILKNNFILYGDVCFRLNLIFKKVITMPVFVELVKNTKNYLPLHHNIYGKQNSRYVLIFYILSTATAYLHIYFFWNKYEFAMFSSWWSIKFFSVILWRVNVHM